MQFFEDMVGAVLEQKDSHGRIICELFKRLPPKDVSEVTLKLYLKYFKVFTLDNSDTNRQMNNSLNEIPNVSP
jgi:hypothetical protein